MVDVLSPGQHLGPFRIVRRLGGGAMGVVFLAVEEELDREVALKIISPDLAGDEGFRERFTREARSQARLNSGHVVQVYRYGEQDGRLFIATQLVPDGDLGVLLGQFGPPLLPNALGLIAQVAEGVSDAHDAGLIHRDIKTANILVRRRSEGLTAYVADFGIARTEDSHQTKTGVAVGTPSYMAPELHLGRQATVRSDIYSLGCLMWATITGSPPYAGTTEFQVIRAHMDAPVRQLAPAGPAIDEVNRILRMSMAKEPEQRYQSAAAMRADLNRLVARMDGLPVPPVSPLSVVGPPSSGSASGPGASGPGSGPVGSGPAGAGPAGSGPGRSGHGSSQGSRPGAPAPGRHAAPAPGGSDSGQKAAGPAASGPGAGPLGSGGYAATQAGLPPGGNSSGGSSGGPAGQASGPGGSSGGLRPLAGTPSSPGGPGGPGGTPDRLTEPGGPGGRASGGGMSPTLKLVLILAAVGIVMIGGVIFAVATLSGGDGNNGGDDPTTSGVTTADTSGQTDGVVSIEDYCTAVNASPGDPSSVTSSDLQSYIDWGTQMESTGAPADMPEEARDGFELKVDDLTGLTDGDFDDPSYFENWFTNRSPSQQDAITAWQTYNTDNC